jgi:hypothetical protein
MGTTALPTGLGKIFMLDSCGATPIGVSAMVVTVTG